MARPIASDSLSSHKVNALLGWEARRCSHRLVFWLDDIQNYEDLLCNSCGSRESQPCMVEWIQLKEPVNVQCTQCLGCKSRSLLNLLPQKPKWRHGATIDTRFIFLDLSAGGKSCPIACGPHQLVLCQNCASARKTYEHHFVHHGGRDMTIKIYLIEAVGNADLDTAGGTSVPALDEANWV